MATMQLQSMDVAELELETPPLPIHPPPNIPVSGIVYGFRTRHLSCIEENDSDSLHGSSIPRAYDLMQQADETFQKLNAGKNYATEEEEEDEKGDDDEDEAHTDEEEDVPDTIAMIDESRLCDADYLDELIAEEQHEAANAELADSGNAEEDFWQPRFNRNDIMMTSCYGTLNSSFGSEMSTPAATPKKAPEPLYATPEKRRKNNRSFDSTCASQTSSIYGGSMNSSLELNYIMSSASTLRGASVPPMDLSLLSNDGISALDWGSASVTCVLDTGHGNPAEELDEETAAKCLSAAESGKWEPCIEYYNIVREEHISWGWILVRKTYIWYAYKEEYLFDIPIFNFIGNI